MAFFLPVRLKSSARSWTAAALCRFYVASPPGKSGRGLPQFKTLSRNASPIQFVGNCFIETVLKKKGPTSSRAFLVKTEARWNYSRPEI